MELARFDFGVCFNLKREKGSVNKNCRRAALSVWTSELTSRPSDLKRESRLERNGIERSIDLKNADGADRGRETLFEVLKSLPRGSFQSFIMSSSRVQRREGGGETYLPRARVERAFAAFVRSFLFLCRNGETR